MAEPECQFHLPLLIFLQPQARREAWGEHVASRPGCCWQPRRSCHAARLVKLPPSRQNCMTIAVTDGCSQMVRMRRLHMHVMPQPPPITLDCSSSCGTHQSTKDSQERLQCRLDQCSVCGLAVWSCCLKAKRASAQPKPLTSNPF